MWIHPDCRHGKKFEVSPNGHCATYRTMHDKDHHPDGHCNLNLVVHHVNTVAAPLLYIECFRQVEEGISVVYDDDIHAFEQDQANVFAESLRQTDSRNRRFRERQLEELQEGIDDIKLRRKMAIADFRSRQGVWVDG